MYDLHNQLVHWATTAPEHGSIVEAETGRSLTYSQLLSAVQKMRQFLGLRPRNLMLTLSGGIADAWGFDRISVGDHVWQSHYLGGPEREVLSCYPTLASWLPTPAGSSLSPW